MTAPLARLRHALAFAVAAAAAASAEPPPAAVRSLIEDGRYADAEAMARAAHHEAVAREGATSSAVARAAGDLARALAAAGKASSDEALEMAEQAVSLSRERGARAPEVAVALQALAEVRARRGDYKAAGVALEEAWAIQEEALAAGDAARLDTLQGLAVVREAAGDRKAAQELLDRAVALAAGALGPGHRRTAALENQLAGLLRRMGDFTAARERAERAWSARRAILPPGHLEIADSLNTIASIAFDTGDYPVALERYREAGRIREAVLGAEHPQVAQILNNTAAVLGRTGDLRGARDLYERALSLRVKALGADHPDVAMNYNTVGFQLWTMGDYAAARPHYLKALAIRESRLGPEHADTATSLNNLAILHKDMGDAEAARPLFERALAIREKALGPAHPEVGNSLHNLARLLHEAGDLDGAQRLYERALAIREERLGPQHALVGSTLNNLGVLKHDRGDAAGSRHDLQRALSIRERVGAAHPDVAHTLVNLARLMEPEDAAGALLLYQRARAIRESALGSRHPDVARALSAMAALHARRREHAQAVELAVKAEEIGREHLKLTAHTLAESQALRFASVRASGLEIAVGAAAAAPGLAGTVVEALIRSRAVVLDEMADRRRTIERSRSPELAPLLVTLDAARHRLANLLVRGPEGTAPERYRELVSGAQREVEGAEQALAARSAVFRDVRSRRPVGRDEVERALPEGAAVVAFSRGAMFDGKDAMAVYVAFVITPGRSPEAVSLGPVASVDALVEDWRIEVSDPAGEGGRYDKAASALRDRVWAPLQPRVAAARSVFVVPDGSLNLVSFAALPDGQGAFLVESGPSFHYASAERDLVGGTRAARPRRGLLALGAPDFDAGAGEARAGAVPATAVPGGCGEFARIRFGPLPGSAREVVSVAAAWRRARRGGVVTLRGAEATEARVRSAVSRPAVLHLATHGFVMSESCVTSGLLVSGLALSGANARAHAAGPAVDGILTAEEIAGLDVSGAELAVLSACDTGVGLVRAGEGVFGLRRAFQVAGVATLVTSLWSADDETTRGWMERLYAEKFERARPIAEAAREASRAVLRERRAAGRSEHPFFWAAFVASGDWR